MFMPAKKNFPSKSEEKIITFQQIERFYYQQTLTEGISKECIIESRKTNPKERSEMQ